MPNVERTVPPVGSYRFVLARWDLPRGASVQVANYSETRRSKLVPWPEEWDLPRSHRAQINCPTKEARDVHMVFVNDRHLRERAIRLGWNDITNKWFQRMGFTAKNPIRISVASTIDTSHEVKVIPPVISRKTYTSMTELN